MTPIERQIRDRIGVPQDATKVLILGMDAHMDWDWLNTFQTLVEEGNGGGQGSVLEIISQAWQLMIDNPGPPTPYMYSVCEMGFLRAALESNPDLVTKFHEKGLGRQLGIEGGGITSPDNLLPHGEAFLRNYLVGLAWLRPTLGLSSTFAYLPDDFGHDVQLPVMLEALGFSGVSFSRYPGLTEVFATDAPRQKPERLSTADGTGGGLLLGGERRVVRAGPLGAEHLLPGQRAGRRLQQHECRLALLKGYLGFNEKSSRTPYVYVPCGCDFMLPNPCLLEIAEAWNRKPDTRGVVAAVGTLGQYLELVRAWQSPNPNVLITRTFDPTPYWTGFYASRPANKILHHAAVRRSWGRRYSGRSPTRSRGPTNWHGRRSCRLAGSRWLRGGKPSCPAPITTTSPEPPSMRSIPGSNCRCSGPPTRSPRARRSTSIQEVATLIGASPGPAETPVAVFNQLGFARTGLVEMTAKPGLQARSVRAVDGSSRPVQLTAEGDILFEASAPSLGYQTCYFSDQEPGGGAAGSVQVSSTVDSVTMENGRLQVVLTREMGWAITSLRPIVAGQLQDDLVPSGQSANAARVLPRPGQHLQLRQRD